MAYSRSAKIFALIFAAVLLTGFVGSSAVFHWYGTAPSEAPSQVATSPSNSTTRTTSTIVTSTTVYTTITKTATSSTNSIVDNAGNGVRTANVNWTQLRLIELNHTATATTEKPRPVPIVERTNSYFLSTTVDTLEINDTVFSSLVQNLIAANVTYLFFNLPNIYPSGYLPDNYTMDAELINRFEALSGNHTFQYFGWTGTQSDTSDVLGNYTFVNIASTVTSLYKAGFQGILIDLEPVPNDSPQFLNMLSDFTRAINEDTPGMLLAVNSMKLGYGVGNGTLWTWDPQYFAQVSSLVNFIVPMFFESGSNSLADYQTYVNFQLRLDTQYSRSPVMYAIPDWYENTTWHHPWGENITNAIITFESFLSTGEAVPNMMGLGIYGLNKTYVLGQGPATLALETTQYDWSFFIAQWVDSGYPFRIGSSVG